MPTKCLLLSIASTYQTWYQIYAKVQPFYLMIKYANYLIIIFMNINEILEMRENYKRNGGVSTKLLLSQLPLFTNFKFSTLLKPRQFFILLFGYKQII